MSLPKDGEPLVVGPLGARVVLLIHIEVRDGSETRGHLVASRAEDAAADRERIGGEPLRLLELARAGEGGSEIVHRLRRGSVVRSLQTGPDRELLARGFGRLGVAALLPQRPREDAERVGDRHRLRRAAQRQRTPEEVLRLLVLTQSRVGARERLEHSRLDRRLAGERPVDLSLRLLERVDE